MTRSARLSPRGRLPDRAEPYRTIGPFGSASLPAGLRGAHSLKPTVWGVLQLHEGSLAFCWDDEEGGRHDLSAPASMVIPPEVFHHLETDGPFSLSVTFYR